MSRLHALEHVFLRPSPAHGFEVAGILLGGLAALWLMTRLRVVTALTLGVVTEVFSGNWKYIPFPLPLERVFIALGFGLLIWRGTRSVSDRRRLLLRPIHFLLLGLAAYVAINSYWARTFEHPYGLYSWLDRLGVIPFLMFTVAPLVFGTQRQRDVLVIGMTVLGLYLGFDAAMEMGGIHALVLPHYINNPNIGIQSGRARGPFLESDAMGLGLFDCAVFAGLAAHRWERTWIRRACVGVMALDGLGIFFTLTRASWLGAFCGMVAAMLWIPRLRRRLPWILAAIVVAVGAAYFTVPGLSNKVTGRVDTVSSLWDRENTNLAAVRAIEAHPVFGIGWQTFETKGIDYMQESMRYPLTGIGLEVHNVFLSHFAELGIPAGLCWMLALFTAVGGAVLRRGPPELAIWRVALLALLVMFLVEADLAPLSYPFPNLVLWLTAGIVARDRLTVARDPLPAIGTAGLPGLVGDPVVPPALVS